MKKLIVPVDFSDASKNAAKFAAQMSRDMPESEILLYHVFDKIAAGTDGTPLFNDPHARAQLALAALNNLKEQLQGYTSSMIQCQAEPGNLVKNLERKVRQSDADLVVMGMNESNRMEQLLVGSSTLQVAARDNFPVLIIPPGVNYHAFRKAAYASDLRNVEQSTPIASLRRILEIFKPSLYVLHVDEKRADSDTSERVKLHKMLEGYQPVYSFLHTNDFSEGINAYVDREQVNLVITVPKKHGLISKLIRKTHTASLAYHTHVPILAIHE